MIALLAAAALLIAEPAGFLVADGSNRYYATGGLSAARFTPLVTTADGYALVAYRDGAFMQIERIDDHLGTTTVARIGPIALIGPANDGFVTYTDGLARRYDLAGHPNSTPASVIHARELLGVGDVTIAASETRFSAYRRNGHLLRGYWYDAASPVALGDDRIAVIDRTAGVVRVYSTALDELAQLRFPGRRIRTIAAGPDGTLAVVHDGGIPCDPSAEIDLYRDPASGKPSSRSGFAGRFIGPIALDATTLYVTTGTCGKTDDTQIGEIGRDGKTTGTLQNVGRPLAILPFGPP
jgi:hypothetical protein